MPERTIFQSMSHRHVISLGPGATVHEAACVMTQANCGSVLIIDGAGTLLGILCLLYTSPSPRDRQKSRMPSSA